MEQKKKKVKILEKSLSKSKKAIKRSPRRPLRRPKIFKIPERLKFPLAWTVFFIIIGIVIQSVSAGRFIFVDFFWKNYAAWFRSFGSFVNPTAYSTGWDLFYAIMSKWYYFLYTGGLISLIWNILALLVGKEVNVGGKDRREMMRERMRARRERRGVEFVESPKRRVEYFRRASY